METDTTTIDPPDTSVSRSTSQGSPNDDAMLRAADATNKPTVTPPATKKPDAAPTKPATTPQDAKSANRSLDAIKPKGDAAKPNGAKPNASTTTPTDADDEKSQTRWQALKAAEARLKELEPKYTEYESKLQQAARERQEWEQKRKDYDDLSQQRDFREVQKRKDWKEKVDAPYNRVMNYTEQVAAYAEVPVRELVAAMNETNPLLREDRIRAVLETGKKEIKAGNIATLVEHGNELERIATEAEGIKANAGQLKEQYENAEKAEKLRTDTEASEVMKRAYKEINDTLKVRAGDVINEEMLKDAMEKAQARSHDPMDRAFRHQAEFLVPQLIEMIRSERSSKDAEIEQLKADLKTATESRPGVKPKTDVAGKKENVSIEQATAMHKEGGHHF